MSQFRLITLGNGAEEWTRERNEGRLLLLLGRALHPRLAIIAITASVHLDAEARRKRQAGGRARPCVGRETEVIYEVYHGERHGRGASYLMLLFRCLLPTA